MHPAWAACATTCHFQSRSLCKAAERPDVDTSKRNMRKDAVNTWPIKQNPVYTSKLQFGNKNSFLCT